MRASARERTRENSQSKKGSKARAALVAAVLFIASLILASVAMQLLRGQDAPSTTVASSTDTDIEAVRNRLDQQVRASMMTVTVSPVCIIRDDGTLDARLVNDPDNTMAQSFSITQDDREVYASEPIDPGLEIEEIEAEGLEEGPAVITVQGHDPETGEAKGSPSAVEVRIEREK